jgi:hypothetical protein
VFGSSGALTFLVGRLAQQGRTPRATLRVSAGRWPTLGGASAFAVTDGRLWLAEPRLLGAPDVASVPLEQVGQVRLRPPRAGGGRIGLEVEVDGRVLRYTALDDDAACRAFESAVAGG